MSPTISGGNAFSQIQPHDELLTVRELGVMFKISPASVYRLVEKRGIPFYRLPNKLRFKKSEVERYLEEHRVSASR